MTNLIASNTQYNNCFTLGAKSKNENGAPVKVPVFIDRDSCPMKLWGGKEGSLSRSYKLSYEQACRTLNTYLNGKRANGDNGSLRVSLYLDNAMCGNLHIFVIDFDRFDENSDFFQSAKSLADKVTRSQGGGWHMYASKEHLLLLADDRVFFLDLVVQLFNQFRLLLDLLSHFLNLFRQDLEKILNLRIGRVVLCVVTIFHALTIPPSSKYFSHDPTWFSSRFDGVFLHDAQAFQKTAQLLFAQSDGLVRRPGSLKTAILQTYGRFDQMAKAVNSFAKDSITGQDIDVVDMVEIKGSHKEARTRRSRSGMA